MQTQATGRGALAVRWSAETAALGDVVRLMVELDAALAPGGGAGPAEVELEVDACYEAPAAAGGGYVPVPVTRMRAQAAAGQTRLEVPWTVALPSRAPGVDGIPAFRARVREAEGETATGLLSIGAVEEVAWVPRAGAPAPRNPAVQAEFEPGETLGLRLAGRGLAGFSADFRIFREGGREGEPRTAVDAIDGVPLQGGAATAPWRPDPARVGPLGVAPFTFEVALRHPKVAYAVKPGQTKEKARLACKVCGKPRLEIVVPDTRPAPCDCEPPSQGGKPLHVKATASVEADGVVIPLDGAIQWVRCKPSGKKGVQIEIPEHDGAEWDYVRQRDDSELIKAQIDPRISSMYGYPEIKESLGTKAVCLAWRDRHELAAQLARRFDLRQAGIIDDPVGDILLIARVLVNECGVKGTDTERNCIAYVITNRARITLHGYSTVYGIVYDSTLNQIFTALAKRNSFKRYGEKPGELMTGPLVCSECRAYRECMEVAARVLADTKGDNEPSIVAGAGLRGYYWGTDTKPPAPGAQILYKKGQGGFLNNIWCQPCLQDGTCR